MKEKPLVSVVIPTHNRAPLLKDALASVYAQEGLGKEFEVEVIVVDDCSTDDTSDVVRQHPDTRYLRLPVNRGASAARNAGLKAATGKYVSFLDDDDEYLPHRLKVQIPILETQPEVGVLYGQSVIMEGETISARAWPETAPSGHVFEEFVTRTDDFIHPATVIVRRELFEKAGYFDESMPTMEHYDMFLRLSFYAPWKFLQGPVACGHFSKEGKWFANVVKGNNERVLPQIIEKALAMLPPTNESDQIKQKARVAVCTTIAEQRWWNGGVEKVRAHLLATLHAYPWMVEMPPVVDQLRRVACELALASGQPIKTVRAFWAAVKTAAGERKATQWGSMQRLLGDFLREAAIGLSDNGSTRRAGLVAACALLHDPAQLRNKALRSSLNRAGLMVFKSCLRRSRKSNVNGHQP